MPTVSTPAVQTVPDTAVFAAWNGYNKRFGCSPPERFRDALEAAMPEIREALAREVEKAPVIEDENGRFYHRNAARILRSE